MYKKRWTDQPDDVKNYPVVLHFFCERSIEVRKVERRDFAYYVTTGNLFGSQTLRVRDEGTLFAVLQIATGKKDKAQDLPPGAEVMEVSVP